MYILYITNIFFINFYFRWPHLEKKCRKHMHKKKLNFKTLVKVRIKCKSDLRKYLGKLSRQFFGKFEYEKLQQCGKRACYNCNDHIYINDEDLYFLLYENNGGHPMNYHFLMDELNSLEKLHFFFFFF